MPKLSFICGLIAASVLNSSALNAQQKDYPIRPVPFTQVQLTDAFWLPRIETNRTATIPTSFTRCENTGRVHNFVMAAQRKGKFCTKYPFDDTDIYKTIEGASYSLAVHPDPVLKAYVDALIDTVAKAQESDGYLYTARTIDSLHPHPWSGNDRWVNEHDNSHELYCSGHMFEAAAAHYLATGQRNFLDIAIRNADLLVRTFGPGKIAVAPGHEIVEMGLVRLYRITGNQDYLRLAKFFIDQRGKRSGYDSTSKDEWKNGEYWQDDKPVIDQEEAEGHAVRAMYLYSGMTDVAALTGDKAYVAAIDRLWENMVNKKFYVQGGIGAIPAGERFGDDYQLPNQSAYNETCAAIGDVFWNQRMFLLHGDSKYIDLMEKVMYNGMLSGVSLDGKSFFYTNAMQVTADLTKTMEPQRSGWFECSCCPTNMLRILPSLPGYIYAQKGADLYINLFIQGTADLKINGQPLTVTQTNNYPWDGQLHFAFTPAVPGSFTVRLRIPGWAREEAMPSSLYSFASLSTAANAAKPDQSSKPALTINGKSVDYRIEHGYAVLSRTWKKGDQITLLLPMPVRKVIANPLVPEDARKLAIQRGPIMYCAEWPDNNVPVSGLTIAPNSSFSPSHSDMLGGITLLKGSAISQDSSSHQSSSVDITLIPYYSWANRGKGEMTVWFPTNSTSLARRDTGH